MIFIGQRDDRFMNTGNEIFSINIANGIRDEFIFKQIEQKIWKKGLEISEMNGSEFHDLRKCKKNQYKIKKKTENESKSKREARLSCKVPCHPQNSFNAQKLRREKAILSPFNLNGLWAARSSALAGMEPT
ncbi:hypothetical protein AVEN_72397-1 [Araneus ventricosus]|uniref:Uncharacterized protein n=1 Tax=Araneus ventricosus TaxID=182803 RepID=A0A4Y2WJV3_ARAVE|nr:hypothetical protein AVEN_72397-1 [Araneus ventricosus]